MQYNYVILDRIIRTADGINSVISPALPWMNLILYIHLSFDTTQSFVSSIDTTSDPTLTQSATYTLGTFEWAFIH